MIPAARRLTWWLGIWSSLSKAFRRAFGHAPGEYRRQQAAAHGVRATAAG